MRNILYLHKFFYLSVSKSNTYVVEGGRTLLPPRSFTPPLFCMHLFTSSVVCNGQGDQRKIVSFDWTTTNKIYLYLYLLNQGFPYSPLSLFSTCVLLYVFLCVRARACLSGCVTMREKRKQKIISLWNNKAQKTIRNANY